MRQRPSDWMLTQLRSGLAGESDQVALKVCELADHESVGCGHGAHLAMSAESLDLLECFLDIRNPD